ncbi:hypothetical protein RBSWK_01766 [Rhodopirellula baltica SWK14]|uniref:Uncharacterized protein n=1 Tax=Rhodopirellula baltica SWK14 TaxID=993516 RepID=L7CIW3_RHOBT|nr:hypothetical protein RBSWK_01766 [Rhodopirellula baltica SWK14]
MVSLCLAVVGRARAGFTGYGDRGWPPQSISLLWVLAVCSGRFLNSALSLEFAFQTRFACFVGCQDVLVAINAIGGAQARGDVKLAG